MTIRARLGLDRASFTLDAELEVPSSGVTAILGPSGCGKTTLLRAIAGLERCPGGFLSVGETIWQDGATFVPTHRRPIGYVFQEASLFDHLTVRGNLSYGYDRVPAAERRVRFDHAVDLMGVGALLGRRPSELSGGERQRVAIGRAILTNPGLLLMDEPLTGLDPDSKREILPYLSRLHTDLSIPILYVSHAAAEVAQLADHLALMDRGKIIATGPIARMLTRFDLPLAHRADAEAIVEATVADHDDEYHLTYLSFPAGRFTVERMDLTPGHAVRLRILARDVSLTQEKQSGTSILNILPATIAQIAEEGDSRRLVKLDVGGVSVLARVTGKSAAVLGLEEGLEVWAQVKSVALLA